MTDSRTYAIYLRKSRKDLDAESLGQTDTLKKHRATLIALAAAKHLTVTQIYEEVVSGDSIAARPEMQKLLTAVEQKAFAGVLVMEVERLARGDTIDQGIVAQTFKYSSTKIVTPAKVYDPDNEFDEEYFEFGLFMSRREYKTINRRLQRGRIASMKEGKFVGNKTPYGYAREQLPHDKGFKLVPIPEQAETVKKIFAWYTGASGAPRLGVAMIVRRLNDMGVPTSTGSDWTNCVVRGMLANPTYAGWLRWGNRAEIKSVADGVVINTRPRAKSSEVQIFKGLHEPIITQEQFDLAQHYLSTNKSRPGPKQVAMANPLSGIVFCDKCGRSMVRRPYRDGHTPSIICPYTSCSTVSSDLPIVESAILEGLRQWLVAFELGEDATAPAEDSIAVLQHAINLSKKSLQQLLAREAKAYELVESGVYTPEVFLQRTNALAAEKKAAQDKLSEQNNALTMLLRTQSTRAALIPNIRHVLEAYPLTNAPEEKNALLKSVLQKVIYHKTIRGYRNGGGNMSLTLQPIIPINFTDN